MRSRISSSVRVGLAALPVCQETMLRLLWLCSSSMAVAEQIWPEVQ